MPTRASSGQRARFDVYQAELSSGELLRSGSRVPIQEQPFHILRLLMESAGQVVTREQIRAALWPEDTFVDFEHGVNTAVRKLRQALEDSVENPRFVETLPRIGYRFMVPVVWEGDAVQTDPEVVRPGAVVVAAPPHGVSQPGPEPRSSLSYWKWRVAPIGLAVALIGWIGFDLFGARRQDPPAPLTVVPFTTFPGFEIGPTFSPDGNQIAFAWFGYEKEYQFELYVKQIGQERAVQLTHHPATFLSSSWSPDGRSIAFMRQEGSGRTGIFLISPLGGPERKLADASVHDSFEPIGLTWSADSQWVAFAKASLALTAGGPAPGHFAIHLVNANSGEERMVPMPSPDCVDVWHPVISPDGRTLASACVLTGGVVKIYLQEPDGSHPREVSGAATADQIGGLAWTVDNRELVYSADSSLWRIPIGGGKPERLLFAPDAEGVSIARTGHRLAFAQTRHPSNIWQLDISDTTRPSGPASKLLASSRGDEDPHMSPDGHSIAFRSWRSGSAEIWVCDRDGSNAAQTSAFGGSQVGSPSWAPDSRRIIFDVRASGSAALYIVDVGERTPKRFVTGTPDASNPEWSADGNWIYFATQRPGGIWKVSLQGGPPVPLVQGEGRGWAIESSDGTRLFFYDFRGNGWAFWSVSPNGGDAQVVGGLPPGTRWLPVRGGFYYISGNSRHFSLKYYETESQRDSKIADLPSLFWMGGITLSPDGRTILFDGIEHSEGDIMLAEGFR